MRAFFILSLKLLLGSLAGMAAAGSRRPVSAKRMIRGIKQVKVSKMVDPWDLVDYIN